MTFASRFLLAGPIADARAAVVEAPADVSAAHHQARLAHEGAVRLLEEPSARGPAWVPAAILFQHAAAQCLVALTGSPILTEPLWARISPTDPFQDAAALLALTPAALAALPAPEQTQAARALQLVASTLLRELERPQLALQTLLVRRSLRIAFSAVAIAALAITATWLAVTSARGPNLAAGKPWTTSSTWAVCDQAARRCGGLINTRLMFHTNEDASPWFEYDLGKPTRFSRVRVINRGDESPDRAVPLLIEVSDDQRSYVQVARTDQPFSTWTAHFPRQEKRFVRVRAPRRTWLHLEGVSVHP